MLRFLIRTTTISKQIKSLPLGNICMTMSPFWTRDRVGEESRTKSLVNCADLILRFSQTRKSIVEMRLWSYSESISNATWMDSDVVNWGWWWGWSTRPKGVNWLLQGILRIHPRAHHPIESLYSNIIYWSDQDLTTMSNCSMKSSVNHNHTDHLLLQISWIDRPSEFCNSAPVMSSKGYFMRRRMCRPDEGLHIIDILSEDHVILSCSSTACRATRRDSFWNPISLPGPSHHLLQTNVLHPLLSPFFPLIKCIKNIEPPTLIHYPLLLLV